MPENNDIYSKVRKANKKDIKSMLELNYNIYPAEWHVSEEYVGKVMDVNPEVYNVLNTGDGIKGIVSLFPLNKENYEAVLQGKLKEHDLSQLILDYTTPKEVYLYLISIIVDINDSNRKNYAQQIIQSIPSELKRLMAKSIKINEIGAIAISPDGLKILPKIGFVQDEKTLSKDTNFYPIFRASVNDMLKAIYN